MLFVTLGVFAILALAGWEIVMRVRAGRRDDARRRRQHRVERDWFATRLFARSRTRRLTHREGADS